MAETNDKVMAMVERELKKNPDATTQELYDKAKKIDKSIDKLSNRQFNARYPLQVKRRTGSKTSTKRRRGRKRRTTAKVDTDRNAIRGVLLDFAREVAGAPDKAAVVEIIGDVDRYVDRVAKAAAGR